MKKTKRNGSMFKKRMLLAAVAALVLAVPLFGCGKQTEAVPEAYAGTFRIGYGKADITPLTSVPLAGFGNSSQRMSESVLDLTYATCIAITDENENTILLMAMDQQRSSEITVQAVRPMISAETGIPENQIMFSATHTHSGPDMENSNAAIQNYIPYLNQQLCQAARDALADRKPATIEAGSIETENMNFVRHYVHTLEDGTEKYFGDSFGTQVLDETTRHTTEADPTMFVVRFTQNNGQEIVLANWRAHPSSTGYANGAPQKVISSDYIGTFRDSIEAQTGCRFVYFNGACGNINASSRIPGEARVSSNNERGDVLATYAIDCLNNNMQTIEPGAVRIVQRKLTLEINHDQDSLLIPAREVATVFKQTGSNAMAIEAGAPYGIRSPYHANAIVGRAKKGQTEDLEINAIAIGDMLSIVTAPNELFDDLSEYVEENSPYAYTLTLCYANGSQGYIPTAYGFEYTSYESDVCNFKPGCGETIRDTMLELLYQLAEEG